MYDYGATVIIKQRGRARRQCKPVCGRIQVSCAILIDLQVGQIAGVRTIRVVETMFFMRRIKVAAGCGKCRAAVSCFMDMDAMHARREAGSPDIDVYNTIAVLSEVSCPDYIAIYVFQDSRCIVSNTLAGTGTG